MDALLGRQTANNQATAAAWALYESHRERIMRLVDAIAGAATDAPSGNAVVLGAGNCNDIDLTKLTARFEHVTLADVDRAAVEAAVTRQPEAERRHLSVLVRELSGALPQLRRCRIGGANRREVEAALRAAVRGTDIGPTHSYELVLSTCLVTQLILSAVSALGPRHPRVVELAVSLRSSHLRQMANLVRPGGAGLLVCDMVSSDTVPNLAGLSADAATAMMADLVAAKNFFSGVNPYQVVASFTADPLLARLVDEVELHEPWVWRLSGSRSYLVYAVSFRGRSEGSALTAKPSQ